MANEFGKITLEGVQDLVADLEKYDKTIQDEVAQEIKASAQTFERNAKRNASRNEDQGRLVQLISQRAVGPTVRELISGAEHSAFEEFGTKSRVRISKPELVQFAQQFKGIKLTVGPNGGLGFRQSIYEWAERKGIPKERWWFIYQLIRKYGRRPNPFFFPAYYEEIPKLRNRLERILNKTEP